MKKPVFSPDSRVRIICLAVSLTFVLSTFFPQAYWKFGVFLLCLLVVFFLISPKSIRSFRNFCRLSLFLISLLLFLVAVTFIFSPENFRNRLDRSLDLTMKAFLVSISIFVFILDGDFADVIKGFYLFRLPASFLAMLTFAYRYSILLQEELVSILRARLSRTVKRRSFLEEMKITGLILNQYFLRLFERSERIYAALLSRGFQGRLDFLVNFKLSQGDYLFLFLFSSVIAAIKFI